MYLFISSNDCNLIYPSNSPKDFTVELPQVIEGSALSLLHVVYYKKTNQPIDRYYYVLCDLVEHSVLGGKEVRVLGSFFESGSLDKPENIALLSSAIKRIRIKIVTDDLGDPDDLVAVYLTVKVSHHA